MLLKADFTWEYIDAPQAVSSTPKPTVANNPMPKETTNCNLPEDFVEPSLDKKIQSQLKKGRATMSHVKKKVAKEYNCDVSDVTLFEISEIKSKAVYHFCVKGEEVIYKRIGNVIIKKQKFF